ncbi:hypothetical protein NLI96_g8121 [Meripilus lineatus]|uniref:Tim44-like domain-containing protein n=1 Tax=Meripilus lineatus TaxID=2056292 RepID=A0AAD5V2N1_9APHY|nr:hypothetical protein NLI96_g8121 [Physisporinus lineatus]
MPHHRSSSDLVQQRQKLSSTDPLAVLATYSSKAAGMYAQSWRRIDSVFRNSGGFSIVRRCYTTRTVLQKTDKKHPHTQSTTEPSSSNVKRGKRSSKTSEKQNEIGQMTNEERLKELEMVSAIEHLAPFDVWAAPVNTFGEMGASILDHVRAFFATQGNWFRNVIALYRMATENAFPGVKVKNRISTPLFSVQSTPWLVPFRQTTLDTYKRIQQAIASGDDKTIKRLTAADYQSQQLKFIRGQDSSKVYVWKFHGEKKPCKVVSIRAVQAHLGSEEPKIGNRLLVQALVKFDTMQSLQVYSKRGALLQGDETPKNVVEYLVFQKRMWYDAPWVVRDRLYEGIEAKVSTSA